MHVGQANQVATLTDDSGTRRMLRRLLKAVDAAPAAKQEELQAAVERAATKAGMTAAAVREYAFGPRQYTFKGLTGCVEQRRSRITGTLSGLYQAEQAGMDAEAGKWSTVCEDHATCVNHATLAAARAHLPDPTAWCDACRENTSQGNERG
jgi:hypothetical protein